MNSAGTAMTASQIHRRKHVSHEANSNPPSQIPHPVKPMTVTPSPYYRPAAAFLLFLFLVFRQFSPTTQLVQSLPSFSRVPGLSAEGHTPTQDFTTDYTNRLNTARRLGRAPPAKIFLRWLHIPKTGTSFVNTLVRWGCPDVSTDIFVVPRKERPQQLDLPLQETFSWDWLFNNESGREWILRNCHGRLSTTKPGTIEPYYSLHMHRALKKWEYPHAVTLFRLPLQRVYSNYLHLSKHYNETRPSREPLQSFLQRSQFWGQQTKLLLGRHYRDERVLTPKEAFHAALIVNKLQFVGLTEYFELSSRLFHAKFGGVPHRLQFENVRPSITRYRNPQQRQSSFRYDESIFDGWTDKADSIVYSAAERRFWQDVSELKDQIEQDGLGPVTIKHLKS